MIKVKNNKGRWWAEIVEDNLVYYTSGQGTGLFVMEPGDTWGKQLLGYLRFGPISTRHQMRYQIKKHLGIK